jgi:hypothetical protein
MKFLVTPTAKKAAEFIFTNIRNTLICAGLAASAFAMKKHPEYMIFGSEYASLISISILGVVVALLLWNLVITIFELIDLNSKPESRKINTILFFSFIFYWLFIVLIFGATFRITFSK